MHEIYAYLCCGFFFLIRHVSKSLTNQLKREHFFHCSLQLNSLPPLIILCINRLKRLFLSFGRDLGCCCALSLSQVSYLLWFDAFDGGINILQMTNDSMYMQSCHRISRYCVQWVIQLSIQSSLIHSHKYIPLGIWLERMRKRKMERANEQANERKRRCFDVVVDFRQASSKFMPCHERRILIQSTTTHIYMYIQFR